MGNQITGCWADCSDCLGSMDQLEKCRGCIKGKNNNNNKGTVLRTVSDHNGITYDCLVCSKCYGSDHDAFGCGGHSEKIFIDGV